MSIAFGIQNIFSHASRERCLSNLRKLAIPTFGKVPSDTAAVLVPMCKMDGVPSLLYTVRSPNSSTNSGDVSFPGGITDKRDETPVQTALRETEEEIGLTPNRIEVWGTGAAIPGQDCKIMITPVIGSILNLCDRDLSINPKEVAAVFTVPIEVLCNPKNHYYTQYTNGHVLPVFAAEQYKIWGITAFITHTFLSAILSKDIYKNEWMKKQINVTT